MKEAIGWRIWHVSPGGFLVSLSIFEHVWERGENMATCHRQEFGIVPPQWMSLSARAHGWSWMRRCEKSPGKDCKCGLWAVWNLKDNLRRAAETSSWAHQVASVGIVMGLVRGWGTIALHGKEGFRAEYASIISLFSDPPPGFGLTDPMGAALHRAKEVYGVPVLSLRKALDIGFLSEFGLPETQLEQVRIFIENPPYNPFLFDNAI